MEDRTMAIRFETENRTKTKSMTCVLDENTGNIIEVEKVEKYKNVTSTNRVKRSDLLFDEYFKEFIQRYYKTATIAEFDAFTSQLKTKVLEKYFKLMYVPK